MNEPAHLHERLFMSIFRAHRRWLILALDGLFVSCSLYVAYQLRFDGRVPAPYWAQFLHFLPFLVALRVGLHWLFGVHHWSFRLAGLPEGARLVLAELVGSAVFVAAPYFLRIWGPPRSVVVIEFFLTTSLAGALRFSPRLTQPMVLDHLRSRSGNGLFRTLIVGAGSTGELLLRDLNRSPDHPYEVVGFVDDDSAKWRVHIGGRPVLGGLEALPEIARRQEIRQLLFAIPGLSAARMREILAGCADLKLKYKILPVSFAYLHDRIGPAMLADLAPEDLLSRQQADFDPAELRTRVESRRILVTGAGGSIGSEICRQLADLGASEIVLLDMNENELYFLYRSLEARYPKLVVRPEVGDIRDRDRLFELMQARRPQYVFHAAAHKHVPLMEWAPEEAVKNNVTGCRHVVDAAEEAGVERFVLISSDKAVEPASVMGATKKVAELMVRDRARRSRTAFTVVRFGNVLGSAGSVVPLFKQQIAAGGPVTVTHPECRRFLMTIGEAVGLVLLAGLGDYGDLCVLEMGDPIRILDLARLMVAMAGLVPDQDIPIVFTGLRPGEKLNEDVMTEEEMRQSRSPGHKIRVVDTPHPGFETNDLIAALETAARIGDREKVFAALRAVVPDYVRDSSAATSRGPRSRGDGGRRSGGAEEVAPRSARMGQPIR
jgi:FlaA1/EpsC-like NDP-sugar epimerase